MKTKTYTAGGVCLELETYKSLRASILETEIHNAIHDHFPQIKTMLTGVRIVLINLRTVIPFINTIQIVEPNESNVMLLEWWEKYRVFDPEKIKEMVDDFLNLPDECSNDLLATAYKNTRRETLPPSEEFQPGANARAQEDPEFKKKEEVA